MRVSVPTMSFEREYNTHTNAESQETQPPRNFHILASIMLGNYISFIEDLLVHFILFQQSTKLEIISTQKDKHTLFDQKILGKVSRITELSELLAYALVGKLFHY